MEVWLITIHETTTKMETYIQAVEPTEAQLRQIGIDHDLAHVYVKQITVNAAEPTTIWLNAIQP